MEELDNRSRKLVSSQVDGLGQLGPDPRSIPWPRTKVPVTCKGEVVPLTGFEPASGFRSAWKPSYSTP